jgi:uncharacterized protein (TIGR03067 family)
MKWRSLLILAAGLCLAADSPKDNPRKELDLLQGTWKAVTIEENGRAVPDEASKDFRLILSGDRALIRRRVNDQVEAAAYRARLDPSTEPRSIDLEPVNATAPDGTVRGVYQLDKDVLKLRLGKPGHKRPPGFALKSDKDTTVLVLQRDRP